MMISATSKGRVYLAAGGTGGHVFTAIAVGKKLASAGFAPVLLTDRRGLRFVDKADGVSCLVLHSTPFSGVSALRRFWGMFLLGANIIRCLGLFIYARPRSVLGFGGYLSVAAGLSARLLLIDLVIHEGNAIFGRANRLLAWLSSKICVSFPADSMRPDLGKKLSSRVRFTGMPIRAEFKPSRFAWVRGKKLRILVLGGSQGAKSLGHICLEALTLLKPKDLRAISIVQQVHDEDLLALQKQYEKLGLEHRLATFFSSPESEIKACNLVICRAGAATLAEIAKIGRPAIFLPLPSSIDGHQQANAAQVERRGAAMVPDSGGLFECLRRLLHAPDLLAAMASKARPWGSKDAAAAVADVAVNPRGLGSAGTFMQGAA